MKPLGVQWTLRGICALLLALALPGAGQTTDEPPPALKASEILPRQLLAGPSYKIEERVRNDGYLNTYQVRSRFGDLTVVSTALLHIRIKEIGALEKMEKLDASQEFSKALAQGGEKAVQGAKNLANNPAGALDSAASGVGKMFKRAGEGLRSKGSKHEDSKMEALLGVAKTKREYALQFEVDPYSSNPHLQKRLDELAQAGHAGGITATALKAMIPGGVGLAASTAGSAEWLKEVDLSLPPTELRMNNRAKLIEMGLASALAEQFINEDDFSPTQQGMIVYHLGTLKAVKGKDAFVKLTLTTQDPDVALFRTRMTQMFAGYHRRVGKLASFAELGKFVAGQTVGGKLVLAFPLDYLVWTESIKNIAGYLSQQAKGRQATALEIWITGSASPTAREGLKALGFQLHEKADNLVER